MILKSLTIPVAIQDTVYIRTIAQTEIISFLVITFINRTKFFFSFLCIIIVIIHWPQGLTHHRPLIDLLPFPFIVFIFTSLTLITLSRFLFLSSYKIITSHSFPHTKFHIHLLLCALIFHSKHLILLSWLLEDSALILALH